MRSMRPSSSCSTLAAPQADHAGGGVLASYEAKKPSACARMPGKARELCPQLICLRNFKEYQRLVDAA